MCVLRRRCSTENEFPHLAVLVGCSLHRVVNIDVFGEEVQEYAMRNYEDLSNVSDCNELFARGTGYFFFRSLPKPRSEIGCAFRAGFALVSPVPRLCLTLANSTLAFATDLSHLDVPSTAHFIKVYSACRSEIDLFL
jgi:hypothetical protein